MRAKSSKANFTFKTKLGLPTVFLLCASFFLAGLFGSTLIAQGEIEIAGIDEGGEPVRFLPVGETGDDFITKIPFQVLSWYPRARYFPNFATAEQCESIISMAEPSLRPSTLALREGETEENTKGIRTSSGVFISASEDKTGILDLIEEKIAKVTMLPRNHGEAFNILRYEVGQRYNCHYDAFSAAEYGHKRAKGLHLSCCIYPMYKKVEKPCSHLRMALKWMGTTTVKNALV
ncbi:hypothetical protein FNV43_RR17087 [Rhamnella rubrinervis]|uniref:Prolyl 4-hydroxylase alpha subunit domain-containing protein n=1 Tax=Rhamnella rubrinervis TaxID=2594499 RepID=A0A8K0DWG0_9ROSA|nr:hypothetical protein FNV43_RR17087 [Rhamnella rubrinervis]